MTDVIMRQARAEDLPALLALIADDVLGKNRDADASDPAYRAAFEAIDCDPNQYLLVAEESGELIGMLQITFIPGLSRRGAWRANVEAVRIKSSLRSRGLGTLLMQRAEHIAIERGVALVQLTSDRQREDAHRFYARLGYVGSHTGFKKRLAAAPSPDNALPRP